MIKNTILKILLSILCLWIEHSVEAQITIGETPDRYYTSMSALMADEAVETPYLDRIVNDGNGLIHFKMADKTLRKALRKEARIVVHQDSLMLNLRHLSHHGFDLGNGYTQAWQLNDTTLLFFAPDAGWKAFGREFGIGLASAALTLGMSGGMFYAYPFVQSGWACYTYSGDGHKVNRLNREEALSWLEEYDADLANEYQSLTDYQRKQQKNISMFMYRLVHSQER